MVTDATVAVNPALVAPAGTVTEPGTVTALLLLDKLTASPPVPAAAESVTVQASLADPVIELLAQLSALRTPAAACPLPLRLMVAVLGEALSVRDRAPVAVPADVGAKLTVRVVAWPGFSVNGELIPDTLKPAPVTVAALMVSGAVPEEVRVTDCVVVVFTVTLPKFRLVVLRVSAGTYALSLIV